MSRVLDYTTVVADMYELKGKSIVTPKDKSSDYLCQGKIYNIKFVDKRNKSMGSLRLLIEVDWDKTLELQNEKGDDSFLENMIKYKKLLRRNEIMANEIHLSGSSYTDDYNDGLIRGKTNWFLLGIEKDVKKLTELQNSKSDDKDDLKELKEKAKNLGVSLRGLKTKESIEQKINEVEQSTEKE